MEEVVARTGLENPFPPRFVDNIQIYVSTNGDTPVPLKLSKKGVSSFFKENSDRIRKFIKANKLKVIFLNNSQFFKRYSDYFL